MTKSKNTSKNIPRFSLRKRINTNIQEHQQPPISYFSKIGIQSSLLNVDCTRIKSKLQDQLSEHINLKSYISSKLNHFNSTSHSFKLITNKSLSDQKPQFYNIEQATQKNNKANNFDPPPTSLEQETKKRQYLSYSEYQDLFQNGKILPSHFLIIAKKNDSKTVHQQISTISKNSQKKNSKSKQKESIIKLKTQIIEGISTIRQKFKIRIKPQPIHQQIKPFQTIISSNLGILSNHTIKQKLQEKWQKQVQKQMINKLMMTEESQMASDKDTRQMTVRDDSNFWSLKKKFKKQAENEDCNLIADLCKIYNEQQKEKLVRIFSKKQKQINAQQSISKGQEYQQFEQNMFKINNSYKPKKLLLKHKIQWKV